MNSNEDIIQGFKASAVGAGLKKGGGRDLALIFSEKVTVAAGVFTTNRVEAAPVILSRKNIQDGKVRAIIANSGNANACTGKDGLENARRTADLVAEELGIKPGETTPDDRFSFELTNCIGACDQAPAIMINNDIHVDLTAEKISLILKSYE